jgi:adenosylhomocysteine nucleosidase
MYSKRILAIILAVLVASSALALTWVLTKPPKPIAIVSALPDELQRIRGAMSSEHEVRVADWTFYEGELYGKQVVLVSCGRGKVNAAAATSLLIERFEPRTIISISTSGAIGDCEIGDVVISLRAAQHDHGETIPIGGLPGVLYPDTTDYGRGFIPSPIQIWTENDRQLVTYFEADNELVELALQAGEQVEFRQVPTLDRTPIVRAGTILSGDQFVTSSQKRDWLNRTFDNASAVDMEGAAMAQVAYLHGMPWVLVRCNSDRADDNAYADIARFSDYAENNVAALVLKMVEIWTG